MSHVLVSVIVPLRDEARHVEATVAAMLAQEVDGELELLLVDGRSTDGTRAAIDAIAERDPRVRVLDNPRRIIPTALNIGLTHARGEFVARMDGHTTYPPGYLATGIARLREGDVDWVAGPQLARGDGNWSRRVALALTTSLGIGGAGFRRPVATEIEADAGFTGVLRRDTLVGLGGWDEAWEINEDGELAARLRAGGGRIVCVPAMAAWYSPRDTLGGLARQYWRYGRYRVRTVRRHPWSMRRSHVLAPALVVAGVSAVAGPGAARTAGRVGLAAYGAASAATAAATCAGGRARPSDAAALPLVLAVMHVSWGAGFLAGCARDGVPLRALVQVARPPAARTAG